MDWLIDWLKPTVRVFPLQRLKQQEEEQEKEYNRLRLTQAKAAILAERSIERKKKEIDRDQADENRRLSAEQRAK